MKNAAIYRKDKESKLPTAQGTLTGLAEINKKVMDVGNNHNVSATHPLLGGQQRKSLIDTFCKAGAEVELIEIVHQWIQKNPLHRIQWY